jgi:hypothetical protein
MLYQNRLFVAVQVHPPAAIAQSVIRWFSAAPSDPRSGIEERRRRLEDVCSLLRVQLGGFGFRRLGYVTRGQLETSKNRVFGPVRGEDWAGGQ